MSNRRSEIVDEIDFALQQSEYVTTYTVGIEDYRKAARQIVEVLEKLGVFDIPQPNSEPTPAVSAMQCYAGEAEPLPPDELLKYARLVISMSTDYSLGKIDADHFVNVLGLAVESMRGGNGA